MNCRSDLLFYHKKYVETNVQVVHVSLSQLTLDEEDDSCIYEYSIKGGVTELKVDEIDVSAENECKAVPIIPNIKCYSSFCATRILNETEDRG